MLKLTAETIREDRRFKGWTKMELEDNVIHRHPELDKELMAVAELIKPLPPEIVPSQEFVERTRLQLLQLPAEAGSSSRKAA